jgi:undecaprenyl-phosphate galactose phosphotransferase
MAVISRSQSSHAQVVSESRLFSRLRKGGKSVQMIRGTSLAAADMAAFAVAFASAGLLAWFWGIRISGLPLTAAHLESAILHDAALLAGVMLYFARRGHYASRLPFWSALQNILTASIVALLCDGFLQFQLHRPQSRMLLGLTWVFFPIAVLTFRALTRGILGKAGLWELRTVVIGSGQAARQAEAALLSEPALGYSVAGIVPTSGIDPGSGHFWSKILRQHRAELLILVFDPQDSVTLAITQSLLRQRIRFAVMPRLGGLPVLGFEQTNFFSHDTMMFTFRNNLAQPISRATKFLFDISVAFVLLILIFPVFLAIAAAVRLDGGPVFFAHRRVGAGGREFNCLKFRSMVPEADEALTRLIAGDTDAAAEWSLNRKLRNDPRVTPIGRILRRTSLDELPQLINVLRMEMSLVGPRPVVRGEVHYYGDDIVYYYETRPGITGLWQVSGRSDTGYEQRVQLDTWYVKNWTLWHDIAILAKTAPAVLQCRGAV